MTIEIVDLGESVGEGLFTSDGTKVKMRKFVLLKTIDRAMLIHGPVHAYPYHANLIDAYCAANEIATHWQNQPDLVEIDDVGIAVRGGGWIEYDPQKQQLRFGGRSTAYGKYDNALLSRFVDRSSDFSRFQVHLR